MYQPFSTAPKALADAYPILDTNRPWFNDEVSNANERTIPIHQKRKSDTDEEDTRVPKRKKTTRPPPAYAPQGYGDGSYDSDSIVEKHVTPTSKPTIKKKRKRHGVGGDSGTPRPRNNDHGDSLNDVVKFELPDEHNTLYDGWNKTKPTRKSIEDIDDEDVFVPGQSDDDDDSDDSIHISRNEKSEVVFDFSTEKARRWTDAINLPENIYNESEQDLFFRLSMRGFEPVLPSHWKFDFPTLPLSLFPEPGLGFEPILQITGASEFYAIKSLGTLFSLGGRVRDCKILRKKPEPLIKGSIKNYIRWAIHDAKVRISKDAVPLHAIYAQRDGIMATLKRLDRRLHYLVGQYQQSLGAQATDANQASSLNADSTADHSPQWLSRRRYPILIGFIVSGPTVVILTRNSDPTSESENSDSTFMCQFDLGERGQDVWNSLAIAITVMHIRRTMMQLAEDGVAGYRKLLEGEKLDAGPDTDL